MVDFQWNSWWGWRSWSSGNNLSVWGTGKVSVCPKSVNVTVCRWAFGATKQSTAAKTHRRSKKESTWPSMENNSLLSVKSGDLPYFLSLSPALLICPPRPNESLISASRTPWPRHRWSAARGFSWRWGPCRPCGCVGLVGTSTHSCPSPWCLLIVSRPGRPLCRRGRSSSLWRRLAARSTQSHPAYPEHWGERTQRSFNNTAAGWST